MQREVLKPPKWYAVRRERDQESNNKQNPEEGEATISTVVVTKKGPSTLLGVVPYSFTFTVFAKGKWLGKDLLDLFETEFSVTFPPGYFRAAFERKFLYLQNRDIHSLPSSSTAEKGSAEEAAEMKEWRKLKNKDVVCHKIHRHEPFVFAVPSIEILPAMTTSCPTLGEGLVTHESRLTDFLVAVNKPPCLPVHGTGKYCHNTAITMLKEGIKRGGYRQISNSGGGESTTNNQQPSSCCSPTTVSPSEDLYACHRLDLGTSGVLIFATKKDVASKIGDLLLQDAHQGRQEEAQEDQEEEVDESRLKEESAVGGGRGGFARKKYLARVSGKFPESAADGAPISVRNGIGTVDARKNLFGCSGVTAAATPTASDNDDEGQELLPLHPDLKEIKAARTDFFFVRFDDLTNESIVACQPFTGRTHQIRVHLAEVLGFPIVNDTKYNPSFNNQQERSNAAEGIDRHHRSQQPLHFRHLPLELFHSSKVYFPFLPSSLANGGDESSSTADDKMNKISSFVDLSCLMEEEGSTTTTTTTTASRSTAQVPSPGDDDVDESYWDHCPDCQQQQQQQRKIKEEDEQEEATTSTSHNSSTNHSVASNLTNLLPEGGHPLCLHAYEYEMGIPSCQPSPPFLDNDGNPVKLRQTVEAFKFCAPCPRWVVE